MKDFPEHIQWIIDKSASHLNQRLEEENISISLEDAMDIFIQADPTPKKQVVDWLVKTYLNQGFLWEDIEAGKDSKVAETLVEYIKYRREPGVQSNLYEYTQLGDVWQSILAYTLKQTGLSGKQERREERNRMLQASIVLHRSDLCIAAVPLTEEAAKWWGRGTRWCTAADKNNYFDQYNNKAPLVVLLFPKGLDGNGNARKFQMWVPNKKTSGEYLAFMDENDTAVSREFITENWLLFSKFILWAKSIEPRSIKWMPENLIDINEVLSFVEQDGLLINSLPVNMLSPEICKIAVNQNPFSIRALPDNYLNEDIICTAIEREPRLFKFIDEDKKTRKLSEIATRLKFEMISTVPKHILDEEMLLQAIRSCDYVDFYYIPKNLISYRVCSELIEKNWRSIRDIPEEFLNRKICCLAVEKDGNAISHVPSSFVDQQLVDMAFKNTPDCFSCFCEDRFEKYLDQDICNRAVLYNSSLVRYVPEKYLTKEIAMIAVENNGDNLYHINKKIVSKDLCEVAVRSYPRALAAVPNKFRSLDLCMLAWERDRSLLASFPSQLITDELLIESIKSFPYVIGEYNIPEALLTSELCLWTVENYPDAIFSIPERLLTTELLEKALEIKPMLYLDSPKELFKNLPSERYMKIAMEETNKKLWGDTEDVLHKNKKKVDWTPEYLVSLEQALKDWSLENSIALELSNTTITP